MRQRDRIIRDDTITDCIRVADEAIASEEPHEQALRIIAALKGMRDARARVTGTDRVDYLSRVQEAAQARHARLHGIGARGDADLSARATVETPIGTLAATVWRVVWKTGRSAWRSEYTLAGEPITVREIKAAGLAKRPTTRTRKVATRD